MAAIHALAIWKVQELAAFLAIEQFHDGTTPLLRSRSAR
jgi:hypothetical protein